MEGKVKDGIHTKDDLKIKNLTLYVKSVDNAIKGNDSVILTDATVTAISTGGDTLKTKNSSLSSKGNQKGTITILGGSTELYACCDGIDAAYDAIISDSADSVATVNIYTNSYSCYSEEKVEKSENVMYLRFSSSNGGMGRPQGTSFNYSTYTYSILYTLDDGTMQWANASKASTLGNYVYYSAKKPANAKSLIVYAYSSSQSAQSMVAYSYCTQALTVNNAYDTLVINGVSNTTLSASSWTNYSTSTSNSGWGNMRPGGMGGMGSGNSNKADFSCKGIKADNCITIFSGTINIKAYDDGIHANSDTALENGETPLGNITITGGMITISSLDDGIHADQDLNISGGRVTVEMSYEGYEANRIYISGGEVYGYATDDCANAAECNGSYIPLISISGGYVDWTTPNGDSDTMDSNGNISITGGIVILKSGVSGSSSVAGTVDCDGKITMTGGVLLAFGAYPTMSNCRVSGSYYGSNKTFSAGDYTLKNLSGMVVATCTLSSSYTGYMFYVAISSSYMLYKGSTSVATFSC